MKFLILLLSLITSLSAIADKLTYIKRWEVVGGHVGDRLQDGKRLIIVWPAETAVEIDAQKYSEELKKGKLYPYQTFKEGIHETYRKFNELSKNFNSCVEAKKWPESKECLKKIKYCFDGKGLMCDTWRERGRFERCKLLDLWKCTQEKEAQLNILKKCFRSDNDMGLRFMAYDNKAIWEDAVGVRLTGTGNEDESGDKFYASCEFVYYKGDFHLIQIKEAGGLLYNALEITIPSDYVWKSKKSENK
jgi:hypothetical protein